MYLRNQLYEAIFWYFKVLTTNDFLVKMKFGLFSVAMGTRRWESEDRISFIYLHGLKRGPTSDAKKDQDRQKLPLIWFQDDGIESLNKNASKSKTTKKNGFGTLVTSF